MHPGHWAGADKFCAFLNDVIQVLDVLTSMGCVDRPVCGRIRIAPKPQRIRRIGLSGEDEFPASRRYKYPLLRTKLDNRRAYPGKRKIERTPFEAVCHVPVNLTEHRRVVVFHRSIEKTGGIKRYRAGLDSRHDVQRDELTAVAETILPSDVHIHAPVERPYHPFERLAGRRSKTQFLGELLEIPE